MVVQSPCAQSAKLAELIAKHGGNPKSQINKTKPNRQNAIQPRDLTSVGVVKCNMEIWFNIVSFHWIALTGGRARRRREPRFHRDPAEDRRHGRGDGAGRGHMRWRFQSSRPSPIGVNGVIDSVSASLRKKRWKKRRLFLPVRSVRRFQRKCTFLTDWNYWCCQLNLKQTH